MKMMFKIIFITAALVLLGLVPEAAWAAKGRLYTQEQILAEFFPGAVVEKRSVQLSEELVARVRKRSGCAVRSPDGSGSFPVWIGRKYGQITGYAVIDDEKGMHEPITFAVLVSPQGAVVRQEVLVYRETEGDGVTQKRFRRQFVGKTIKDPIRAGVDVMVVSGATISSHSMAVGVKRALALVTEEFLAGQTAMVAPGSATAGGL